MAGEQALVEVRPEGLYCPAGDFHIDPWRPVARAVITHAHADHARRLVVLGDWLHARASLTPAVQQAVAAWRARHAALARVLVRGNHDDRAGDPPAPWGFTVVAQPWPLGPWQCRHTPPDTQAVGGDTAAGSVLLCGHRHPVCIVRGLGRDRLRLPCFALDGPVLCLPAFGAWTGGHPVPAAPGVQRWAIADDTLWPLEGPVAPWRALEP